MPYFTRLYVEKTYPGLKQRMEDRVQEMIRKETEEVREAKAAAKAARALMRQGKNPKTVFEDYIGRRVSKMFSMDNHGKWYDGTITSVDTCCDTGELLFHVEYDDGDSEDIYFNELDDVLIK